MEAENILKQVGKTYAGLSSYKDEGALTISKNGVENRDLHVLFRTFFKRPNLFRFETRAADQKSDRHLLLWCDGKKVSRHSNGYTQELSEHFIFKNTMKDLARALSSIKEARPVASLLFDKLSETNLTDLKDIKYAGEEIINGQGCHHLRADEHDKSVDLWISTSTSSILKIVERQLVVDSDETMKKSTQFKVSKRIPIVLEFVFHPVVLNENLPSNLFNAP
jgi:outer membrane lipoprotein-sorting protein